MDDSGTFNKAIDHLRGRLARLQTGDEGLREIRNIVRVATKCLRATSRCSREATRQLLDSIDVESMSGLRDRALIATMTYSFARIGAVLAMKVEDYYPQGKRWWLRLHEKGGKRHEVPCHHLLEEDLDAYCEAAQLWDQKKSPLVRRTVSSRDLRKSASRVSAPLPAGRFAANCYEKFQL